MRLKLLLAHAMLLLLVGMGNSQTTDSDGDGIADLYDRDDDNDGIIDEFECNEWDGLVVGNFSSNFNASQFLDVRPSDFGITAVTQDYDGSADFSSLYGLPTGSIIVTIENGHKLDNTDRFQVREDLDPTKITISGSYPTALQVEQGQDFYDPGISKYIEFPNGNLGQIEDNGSNVSGNPAGTTVTESGNTFTLTYSGSQDEDILLSKRVQSGYDDQVVIFGVSDNDPNVDRSTAFFFRLKPICDYDGDGTPDRLDLDSDNDGCYDALEGAMNTASSFPGTIPTNSAANIPYLTSASGVVTVGSGSTASGNQNYSTTNGVAPVTNAFPGVVLDPGGSGGYWYQHVGLSQDENSQPSVCLLLPVTYATFTATEVDNGVLLEWITVSENNNSHFMVERSDDGKVWKEIGKVNGSGTISYEKHYSFNDASVSSYTTQVFYRLKQIDFDGAYEYSKVVSLTLKERSGVVTLYPNPVVNQLNIRHSGGFATRILILDICGKPVISSTDASVDLAGLSNGVYLVKVFDKKTNEVIDTQKIVLSR